MCLVGVVSFCNKLYVIDVILVLIIILIVFSVVLDIVCLVYLVCVFCNSLLSCDFVDNF